MTMYESIGINTDAHGVQTADGGSCLFAMSVPRQQSSSALSLLVHSDFLHLLRGRFAFPVIIGASLFQAPFGFLNRLRGRCLVETLGSFGLVTGASVYFEFFVGISRRKIVLCAVRDSAFVAILRR